MSACKLLHRHVLGEKLALSIVCCLGPLDKKKVFFLHSEACLFSFYVKFNSIKCSLYLLVMLAGSLEFHLKKPPKPTKTKSKTNNPKLPELGLPLSSLMTFLTEKKARNKM